MAIAQDDEDDDELYSAIADAYVNSDPGSASEEHAEESSTEPEEPPVAAPSKPAPVKTSSPSGKRNRATAAPTTAEPCPHHYSESVERWSRGFRTEAEALLAARAAGLERVYLGISSHRRIDVTQLCVDVLDAMGYDNLSPSDEEKKKLGSSISSLVQKAFGPPLTIEPTTLVTLDSLRPRALSDIRAIHEHGHYVHYPNLFISDIARVLGLDPPRITGLLEAEGSSEKTLRALEALYSAKSEG